MLPCHIIEEILKRERERESKEELFIDPPDLDDPWGQRPERPAEDNETSERGVVIIDFTT